MKSVGEKAERKNSISTGVESQTHLNIFHTQSKQKQASFQKLVSVVQFRSQICLSFSFLKVNISSQRVMSGQVDRRLRSGAVARLTT